MSKVAIFACHSGLAMDTSALNCPAKIFSHRMAVTGMA